MTDIPTDKKLSERFAAAVCEPYDGYGEQWCHIGDLLKEDADAILSALRLSESHPSAEVARLHERLEDNHVFVWDKATNKMLRQEVEPGSVPDGIECRNDTIKLQDENLDQLRSENARLTAALEEVRGALEASRSFVELAYEETDREEAADAKIVMGQIDAAIATTNAALGRVEG